MNAALCEGWAKHEFRELTSEELASIRFWKRLQNRWSRGQLKGLPLAMLLELLAYPQPAAPRLFFLDESFADRFGRTRLVKRELDDLRENAKSYTRTADPVKRRQLAWVIRKTWVELCDKAIGYAYDDDPRSVYGFD